jgi:hypothetical protein
MATIQTWTKTVFAGSAATTNRSNEMTEDNSPTEPRASWYWRLWVRLTSKRATRAEIESQDISPEEMDRSTAKLMKRMEDLRQ